MDTAGMTAREREELDRRIRESDDAALVAWHNEARARWLELVRGAPALHAEREKALLVGEQGAIRYALERRGAPVAKGDDGFLRLGLGPQGPAPGAGATDGPVG